LISKIIAWAKDRGIVTLKLDVTSNNDRAISFYQQLGFSMTGNAKPYPNDPTLTEWEMAKLLR
jgi:ribosomal protein S18 acetylase RimI-like enzyme